jgi:hypothetical protein
MAAQAQQILAAEAAGGIAVAVRLVFTQVVMVVLVLLLSATPTHTLMLH